VLLPSGPDTVRDSPLRGTRSSTSLEAAALESGDLGWEFSPAGADCRYRAPLVPRLARHRQSSADRRVETPGEVRAHSRHAHVRDVAATEFDRCSRHTRRTPGTDPNPPVPPATRARRFRRRPVAYSRHPGIDGAEPRSPRALGVAGEAKAARQHQTEPRRPLTSSTPGGRRGEADRLRGAPERAGDPRRFEATPLRAIGPTVRVSGGADRSNARIRRRHGLRGWRRGRDSNPRRVAPNRISSAAP
jgi:hypothetical protein